MKKLLLICLFIFPLWLYAQETGSTALLIIDIQDFYFPEGDVPLSHPDKAAAKAALLLEKFRKEGSEVIFIRHNYQPGGEINELVKPLEGEKIISKNSINSFLDTGLDNYLRSSNIDKLVICGMQTHMCVEAAVRAASDLGYDCTLIHDACATRDLGFGGQTILARDVHLATLSTLRSYARVISSQEFLEDYQ